MRPIPRSLSNIYKELRADLGLATPQHGDLTPWAEHGVLLLNRVAHRPPGASASHRGKGWEPVTEQAIRALVARGTPAGRDPVGPRRADAAADARATPRHRVGAPAPMSASTAASSARARSAAPTRCSSSRAPSRSTGRSAGRQSPHLTRRPAAPGSRRAASGPQRVGVMRMSDLFCVAHGGAVLVPVGVLLAGDAAEVLDQGVLGLGHVEHLGLAVDLHPRRRPSRRTAPARRRGACAGRWPSWPAPGRSR